MFVFKAVRRHRVFGMLDLNFPFQVLTELKRKNKTFRELIEFVDDRLSKESGSPLGQ